MDENEQILNLFMSVYGSSKAKSEDWIKKGFKTIEDLKNNTTYKNLLDYRTKVGVKYYDDLKVDISRDEIQQISKITNEHLKELNPNLELHVCGSYRR